MSNYNGERIETMRGYIAEAAEIIGGNRANPLEVFPNPKDKERRADIEWGKELTYAQQEELREVMGNLGPGRKTNYGPEEARLNSFGYLALLEGGQPHKMKAQLNLVTGVTTARPSELVMSGSTERFLGETEIEIGRRITEKPLPAGLSEIEMAERIVDSYRGRTQRDGFHPLEARPLLQDAPTHRLERIGAIGLNQAVILMGIKRVPTGEENKYTQLSNAEKMILVAQELGAKTLAFITSSAYQPSNEVQAYFAAKNTGTDIHVLSYGARELAQVKNETVAEPSIAQLGAEAFKTAEMLRMLDEKL